MLVGKEDKKRGRLMVCLLLEWNWDKGKVWNPAVQGQEGEAVGRMAGCSWAGADRVMWPPDKAVLSALKEIWCLEPGCWSDHRWGAVWGSGQHIWRDRDNLEPVCEK